MRGAVRLLALTAFATLATASQAATLAELWERIATTEPSLLAGLAQARAFKEVCEIGGIILTKLDGTAKGGIALAIRQELEVPVWYIGVGEGIDDLQPFNAKDFVEALF